MVKEFSYSDRMFDRTIPNNGRTMEDFEPDNTSIRPEVPQKSLLFQAYKPILQDGARRVENGKGWTQMRRIDNEGAEEMVAISGIGETLDTVKTIYVYKCGSNEFLRVREYEEKTYKIDPSIDSEEQIDHVELIERIAAADII